MQWTAKDQLAGRRAPAYPTARRQVSEKDEIWMFDRLRGPRLDVQLGTFIELQIHRLEASPNRVVKLTDCVPVLPNIRLT